MKNIFFNIFGNFRTRLLIEGIMPERALLRLRRAGIAVFNAKKVEKNKILLSVNKKDSEKVFAIYPNMCYNISVYSPFTVKKIGEEGLGKYLLRIKNRVGLLLGGLLFVCVTVFFQNFVFAVDFRGTDVYAREAHVALAEAGIRPFAPYREGREDEVCAKLLALQGVEYCSVKKTGMRLVVEIQTSPFSEIQLTKGSMYAKHTGKILAITALRGEAVRKAGDTVKAGEMLVADRFTKIDGGQVCVEPIAYARIACAHEGVYEAESEEEAFAKAYLQLGLSAEDVILTKRLENRNGSYRVCMEYVVTERINF